VDLLAVPRITATNAWWNEIATASQNDGRTYSDGYDDVTTFGARCVRGGT